MDHNQASYGGAVFQVGESGSVTVSNSMISNNSVTFHGGGLYVSGSAALTNTQLSTNTAGYHGAGCMSQGPAPHWSAGSSTATMRRTATAGV